MKDLEPFPIARLKHGSNAKFPVRTSAYIKSIDEQEEKKKR
jgi:hypothetical protein